MVKEMKAVAEMDVELTIEERNLLSVAYKNVIGARRASWRIISNIEQKEEGKGNPIELIRTYRQQIETELKDICMDILQILDKNLIPTATAAESSVFYLKMWVVGSNFTVLISRRCEEVEFWIYVGLTASYSSKLFDDPKDDWCSKIPKLRIWVGRWLPKVGYNCKEVFFGFSYDNIGLLLWRWSVLFLESTARNLPSCPANTPPLLTGMLYVPFCVFYLQRVVNNL